MILPNAIVNTLENLVLLLVNLRDQGYDGGNQREWGKIGGSEANP